MASYCGLIYALRSLLVILVMIIGLMGDDPIKYTNFGDDQFTNDRTLFQYLYSWGNDIRLFEAD